MNYKTAKAVNELYARHTLAIGLWIWTTSKVLGTVVLDDHSAICFILSFLMWTASNFSWDLYWISRCCLLCSVPPIYSVSYNSSFVQAWITLGRAQLNFGEPDKAIESFERALAIKVHNQMCHLYFCIHCPSVSGYFYWRYETLAFNLIFSGHLSNGDWWECH